LEGKQSSRLAVYFKNPQLLLFCAISAMLTLWYCKFIFTPSTEMLGVTETDAFQSFAILAKNTQVFQTGNIPFGAFWLPDFYGGAIATYFHVSIIPEFSHTSLLALNFFAGDFVLSLKIYAVITLLIAQILSYKLANLYFKNQAIAWVLSIGYSFSTFYLSQLNDGHCNFLAGAALVPGVLLVFEKLFNVPNFRNMLLSSVALIVLFFADLQITIFTIYFLLFRTAYYLLANKGQSLAILKHLFRAAVVFSLCVAPFLVSFVLFQNTNAFSVSEIPTQYLSSVSELFSRNIGTIFPATNTTIYSLYVGTALFALAILPIAFFKELQKPQRRNYNFHLLMFLFFILIAVGTIFSTFVTAVFVRVPSRSVLLIDLSVCICAGYGILSLCNFLKNRSKKIHLLRRNRKLITLLAIGLAAVVFVDLTFGMAAVTSPMPKLSGADQFIQNQTGDFRVLKYPVVWAYANYESALINHEIVGESAIAIRYYPTASEPFVTLTQTFDAIVQFNKDPGNFALQATLCGVKYILVDTSGAQTTNILDFFSNATEYFAQAYIDQGMVIYENLYFKGTAFALKDTGQVLTLTNLTLAEFENNTIDTSEINFIKGFNTLQISGYTSQPAYIILSQSYSPQWTTQPNTPAFTEGLNLTAFHVDTGNFKVDAYFSASDKTINLFILFFASLILAVSALYANAKVKKKTQKLTLFALLAFGTTTTIMACFGTPAAPAFLRNCAVFTGIYNKVALLMGATLAVAALIFLSWTKITKFSKILFSKLAVAFLGTGNARSKWLFVGSLAGSLGLIVLAIFMFATSSSVFDVEYQAVGGKYLENHVISGTQFFFGAISTLLLAAAILIYTALGYFVARDFLFELKQGVITNKLVEIAGLCLSLAAALYLVLAKGVVLSLNIIHNELFGIMLIICCSLLAVGYSVLRKPKIIASVFAFQNKLDKVHKFVNTITIILMTSTLFFIVLANIPNPPPGSATWLNDNILALLLSMGLLFLIKNLSPATKQDSQAQKLSLQTEKEGIVPSGIKSIQLGMLGGAVGTILGGLFMWEVTLLAQDFVGSALIVCGALGGLGFGLLTSGNNKLRGVIGCLFGLAGILFGLVMAFDAPIVVGYLNSDSSDVLVPLYRWHGNSFGYFVVTQFSTMDGIFYSFWGLISASLCGFFLSRKHKLKKPGI
jgi:hypothetical protein